MEIDEDVLQRAKHALGLDRTRDTIDAALRRVAEDAEADVTARSRRLRDQLAALPAHADLDVLRDGAMWR